MALLLGRGRPGLRTGVQASRIPQRAAQQKLDLGVQAAQVGVGPALQRFVRRRVEPKQECLSCAMRVLRLLLVQRARVDDGLGIAVAAQHHQQIAHHAGLALLVELDDMLGAQQLERHLDHANRALDDLLPRGDDGVRLLPPQHRAGDLGGVRQMVMRASMTSMPASPAVPESRRCICARSRPPTCAATSRLPVRVVRVTGRQVAHGRFALHMQEVLVVVHPEHGLGRIDDAPDDDGGDLDRIAVLVVDLQLAALEIPDSAATRGAAWSAD